jgi:hypothetical protein
MSGKGRWRMLLPVDVSSQQVGLVQLVERSVADDKAVQNECRRIQVSPIVDSQAIDLLRAGIPRRANQNSGARRHRWRRWVLPGERLDDLGHAEIEHLEDLPTRRRVVKKQIRRFDVAVDDSNPMRRTEGSQQL